MVIDTDFARIEGEGHVHSLPSGAHAGPTHECSEIVVEVFRLKAPVGRQHPLEARAGGPARLVAGSAPVGIYRFPDIAECTAGRGVEQQIGSGCPPKPAARAGEPAIARPAGKDGSKAIGRAGHTGPPAVAFDAKDNSSVLPIVAGRAADKPAAQAETAPRRPDAPP